MTAIDDTTLTETGLTLATSSGRILLIACGALAREVLTITKANGWTHIDLTCLPAIWHNTPNKIGPAIQAAVAKHRAEYDAIYVLYADCGTGGQLFDLCNKLGVEMLRGPHCYSFYEGNAEFAERSSDEIDAFYLTDFLVRQFDAFVWKPLGLDRHPYLRDTYFGNYNKLVYQAQINDPGLDARARECAGRLGLKYERRFTGYGDLGTSLQGWLS